MNKFTLRAILFFVTLSLGLKSQQWNGLTLYSNMGSSSVYLIDTNSTNIKVWSFTGNGGTGYSTHMMPGGEIWRSVQNTGNVLTGGGMTGRIQKWDYAGTKLWDYTYSSSTYCLHHDHCPLPNGNVLVISYDVKTATDVVNAGGTNSITVWSEKILELKPIGTNSAQIVWQWNVWDHLVQNVNSMAANYQTSIVNHPELLNINYQTQKDWMHMNGIDYNPILDQIIISSHNLNEWYVIDHSTTTAEAASHSGGNAGKGGDFLYRWGNPLAYQAAGTKILDVTHDCHWIKEGVPNAGYMVGVNNKGSTGPKTTIDQISPPRSNYNYTISLGNAYTPSTFNLRHTSTGYTSNMGSSNQFPNGNQMVCLATVGSIYEIDAANNVLWSKSTGGSCPQAHRYTQCYVSNAAPAQPSISVSGNDLVSTTGVTYQWYVDGNLIPGAVSQTITPTQNGIYVVRITDANGCVYAYSSGYTYALITGLKENQIAKNLNIYPNPTNGKLTIDDWYIKAGGYKVTITDALGNVVLSELNNNTIDLSSFESGIYFVSVYTAEGYLIQKRVSLAK